MKKAGIILGTLLLLAITVTGCHFIRNKREALVSHGREASRHMQNSRPNVPMYNMRRGDNQRMQPGMRQGMRRGMGPGMRQGMRRGMGMGYGPGNGMMGRMQQGSGYNNRNVNNQLPANAALSEPISSGGIFIDNIPNVTEKQKKEFADLKLKQQEEMAKMRNEMAAKIKSTLEAQRSKMLNLFTNEQKKFIGPESVNKH